MSPSSYTTTLNMPTIVNLNQSYEYFSVNDPIFKSSENGNNFIDRPTPKLVQVDSVSSSNSDAIICPQCFTPQSIFYVIEDAYQGRSKEFYVCMSHGDSGCGWQGDEQPNDDDTKKLIKDKIGYIPLRLN
ncbi:9112_t:CDS:1 [Gigaspora margarita]|nr:9112_t:CDS:1 [Gigaspora margarita]